MRVTAEQSGDTALAQAAAQPGAAAVLHAARSQALEDACEHLAQCSPLLAALLEASRDRMESAASEHQVKQRVYNAEARARSAEAKALQGASRIAELETRALRMEAEAKAMRRQVLAASKEEQALALGMADDLITLEKERQLLKAEVSKYRQRCLALEERNTQLDGDLTRIRAVCHLLENNSAALAAVGQAAGAAPAGASAAHLPLPPAVLAPVAAAGVARHLQGVRELMRSEVAAREDTIQTLRAELSSRDLTERQLEGKVKRLDQLVTELLAERALRAADAREGRADPPAEEARGLLKSLRERYAATRESGGVAKATESDSG